MKKITYKITALRGVFKNQSNDFDGGLFTKKVKGSVSSLRQFLTTKSPLKMMKNTFLFHVKGSFRS